MIKVFLSSTGRDLQAWRDAAFSAIQRLEGFQCVRMEDFGAIDKVPLEVCVDGVAQCNVLVGIVGHVYGSCPPGSETSYTESEYDTAVNEGKPRLMFVAPSDFPVPANLRETEKAWKKQQRFRKRIMQERVVCPFDHPQSLATRIVQALANWKSSGRRSQGSSHDSQMEPRVAAMLQLSEPLWREDRSPPGSLLRSEYGIVPFHGREHELKGLLDWSDDDAVIGIRLLTGAGGMGKTRLAKEACLRLRDRGWSVGFFDYRRSNPESAVWAWMFERKCPLLVVVDYAETGRDALLVLLHQLCKVEMGKIRLILLARAADDWWHTLKCQVDAVGELLSGPATERFSLGPLATNAEQRRDSYQRAAEEFSKVLHRDTPQIIPDDLDEPHFDRVLFLHMSALSAVEGVVAKGEDGILDYVLGRERRFWSQLANDRSLPHTIEAGIGRAMAAITLGGGADTLEEAITVVKSLRFFADQTNDIISAVVSLLHDTYPGEERCIEPVLPDLLGEHLVQVELDRGSDELLNLVLGEPD